MSTQDKLADALDCFWNAAIGPARDSGDFSTIQTVGAIAEGFAAVSQRLREHSEAHAAEKGKADGDYVLVPRWKLARAAAVVMRDGDEHGVGADIEAMLSAAPANPPAPEPQTTPNDTRVTDEWPTHRACTPYKNGSRIVGFVINEGDPAWGEIGLSEPLFWLDRMCKGQSVPLPAEPVADETESLLRRAMDVCLEVVKGGKLAAHNAANLRNQIDVYLRHATIADLRQQPVKCAHSWHDFGSLGGRNVVLCVKCDRLDWTGSEGETG